MSNTKNPRWSTCKFCHPYVGPKCNEYQCLADGWEKDKVKTISKEDCENCDRYKSRYIEYPVTINGIENTKIPSNTECLEFTKIGSFVYIEPCGEEYQNKKYIGILLGNLPIFINTTLDNNQTLRNSCVMNPAIFVPELNKIIYGCESWWSVIPNTKHLADTFIKLGYISEDEFDMNTLMKTCDFMKNLLTGIYRDKENIPSTKHKVITLCGSRRFTKEMIQTQQTLTEKGYIVHTPMMFDTEPYRNNKEFMTMFREMHCQKIDMSDGIFVVNPNGYIGEHTKKEIEYAISQNKTVEYLESQQ